MSMRAAVPTWLTRVFEAASPVVLIAVASLLASVVLGTTSGAAQSEPSPLHRLPLEELLAEPAAQSGGSNAQAEVPHASASEQRAQAGGVATVGVPGISDTPTSPNPAAGPAAASSPTDDAPARPAPASATQQIEDSAPEPSSAAADSEPYLLSPGDVLNISVWREDQLQRELVVLPDGTISFPLAGRVEVSRKTTEQVEQILAIRLKKYIPDAAVSVSVVTASGYRIYVVGAVNKPGEFQVPRRITVMQALSLAGGLTPFAGEDSIRIIRRENDQTIAIPFAYSDVKRGRKIETDIELKSGDTVVVAGESLF